MANKRYKAHDVIKFVCEDESDESDNDEFDGYVDKNEIEKLVQRQNYRCESEDNDREGDSNECDEGNNAEMMDDGNMNDIEMIDVLNDERMSANNRNEESMDADDWEDPPELPPSVIMTSSITPFTTSSLVFEAQDSSSEKAQCSTSLPDTATLVLTPSGSAIVDSSLSPEHEFSSSSPVNSCTENSCSPSSTEDQPSSGIEDLSSSGIEDLSSSSSPPPTATVSSAGKCTSNMDNKSPLDFFKLLVTDDILENIVDQTSLYAVQYFAKQPTIKPRSRLHSWNKKLLTVPEFLRFFALIIVMGIVRFPKMEDHWAQKWPFGAHSFRKIMSRDRFAMILKFFHVNDSSKYIRRGENGYDPLYKIRPLLESLLRNFQMSYIPNKQLSLDEAMVSFKGRAWFMQYMPKKPKKWGLKAYALADSNNGYTLNWRLYAGTLSSMYM